MNDFKTGRFIRTLLTRLRLDSGVIQIHYSQGHLTLTGTLQYPYSKEGYRSELSYELLHEMDRQLHHVEDIKQITYIFDNWSHNSDGHWTKKMRKKVIA